ncbi:Fe-S cluster assembly protein SufD [Flavihumibacter sp. R14]|nr:Fe-S cluster assembly protein SufD [Flavihumibacter soli]
MDTIEYLTGQFHEFPQDSIDRGLDILRQDAFNAFNTMGIPGMKHEEWKYTRINKLFNTDYSLSADPADHSVSTSDLGPYRLPGNKDANELFFINGRFAFDLSVIQSAGLQVLPISTAYNGEHRDVIAENLSHSSRYLKDGINALNTAFLQHGVFIQVGRGLILEHPVYIYNITDARTANIFSQPRSLVNINEGAQVQMVETFITFGMNESFTNQVMEVVVQQDAVVEYYKIQNDASHTNQVSTTHFRQTAKSYVHTVTISLNGGIVRNNLNMVMDAEHCESHLYGLYFQQGKSHIDNHTIVDNAMPNCLSNEFYKGILDGNSSGVFNGKIFVQRDAQKTNAYQSNKNVLLSEEASVNTKPQLEIFADDVKCSHGCTVGRLDEEGLFYLRSRGISEKIARSLLLHGFVVDILDKIRLAVIRNYADQLISERLEFDIS